MRFLSAEDILVLHALVIDATGGSHGVREKGLLSSLAAKPTMRFGGKELYPNLFSKAAILVEAIANYHVFVDGNKRTALVAVGRFLFLNGYELSASQIEAEETILAIATKNKDVAELEKWLKNNSRKISR
jgi:death-on-curing protein